MTAALESAVAALRSRPAATPAALPAPDAAAVVARLTAALRDHDTRFLDDYLLVLVSHNDMEVKAITDELMCNIEGALAAGNSGGANGQGPTGTAGVVLATWLAAALTWRAPRPAAAARALFCMLQDLTPQQVMEVARALHGSLGARELVVASDALRGAAARGSSAGAAQARAWALAGRAGLAALLLRAALGALLSREVAWRAGALSVEELCAALSKRWNKLDAQLTGASVAARVMAGAAAETAAEEGAGAAAARLLAVLAHPPPPALRHHPEYLKATIALSRLQKLFESNDLTMSPD